MKTKQCGKTCKRIKLDRRLRTIKFICMDCGNTSFMLPDEFDKIIENSSRTSERAVIYLDGTNDKKIRYTHVFQGNGYSKEHLMRKINRCVMNIILGNGYNSGIAEDGNCLLRVKGKFSTAELTDKEILNEIKKAKKDYRNLVDINL